MTPQQFVNALQTLKFENTFNPYVDQCTVYDVKDAPLQRAKALREMLEAASRVEIDALWIGRDLGHRGGRRTGLALTDEAHLVDHGKRWGMSIPRLTNGPAVSERTATVIWDVLSLIEQNIFLWNVFPLHPHDHNSPFTNRTHNGTERRAGIEMLDTLIGMLRPKRLVAIGNDAFLAATRLGSLAEVIQVRHPSYGGQASFMATIRNLYSIHDMERQFSLI
jgi:hypothetical protein